jgi:hypothetical protein
MLSLLLPSHLTAALDAPKYFMLIELEASCSSSFPCAGAYPVGAWLMLLMPRRMSPHA